MNTHLFSILFSMAIFMPLQAKSQNDVKQALQMLADFTPYLVSNYHPISDRNSANESLATFNGENTFGNNEQGVRHNADLSMICAFLCKYGKGKVTLPQQVTWEQLANMGRTTLSYAYSTHKANRLYPCKNNQYWGSVSLADHSWESSLWAMSVAYSAFFQWNELSNEQQKYIYNLLKAECNYELERSIPTGFRGDTKAEENGWECDVLAVTIGLFPNDPLAEKWFNRLRQFAVNSYSHPLDKNNNDPIDPHYDTTTIADLYQGPNLYDDFTLQNHNYFHTSYQNVVAQELGEAALALKLFQNDLYNTEKWKTNTLMHNVGFVMSEVLYCLALTDGELAMPNGNDWSLFLYDQLTSYSTAACFLRDTDALMLEQQALHQIAKRQKTTTDGSWLLRADVGARRMGVEAHRVMMTWLMHHVMPTDDLTPTTWPDFLLKYSSTNFFPEQDVITASSEQRFTCFSWSQGLHSYTGYFAPVSEINNNIIVPFRANNTGNFIGWYEVEEKKRNAVDVKHSIVYSDQNSYIISGTLDTNDKTLRTHYMFFAAKHNLILYFDMTRALTDCTINKERGGLLAISTDPFTRSNRSLYVSPTSPMQSNGDMLVKFKSNWINIDNSVGVVCRTKNDNHLMAFGDKQNNNSILTSKLYASFSDTPISVKTGDMVDNRVIAYYSNVSAEETEHLNTQTTSLKGLPIDWKGYQIIDTDNSKYLVVFNMTGNINNRINLDRLTKDIKPKMTIIVTIADNQLVVLPIES